MASAADEHFGGWSDQVFRGKCRSGLGVFTFAGRFALMVLFNSAADCSFATRLLNSKKWCKSICTLEPK